MKSRLEACETRASIVDARFDVDRVRVDDALLAELAAVRLEQLLHDLLLGRQQRR